MALHEDGRPTMEKYRDGEWYVFKENTRKTFERFKIDATKAAIQGIPALFTTTAWRGNTIHATSFGTEASSTFEEGMVTCRVRFTSVWGTLLRDKILSDVEMVMFDVCGTTTLTSKDVFVVHGHDHAKRSELKDILIRLGLRPIILDEQDDLGMTIIEKFEYYAATCSFGFVLMTPDDMSKGTDRVESQWRARQNVIMELGWFMAHLGRERVIILCKQVELEIPSDILGVLVLKFNDSVQEVEGRIQQRLRGLELIS
jgi:predicted nucleotide-binding protein